MSADEKSATVFDAGLQSVGLVLRKKRSERGMSIEDVARHTGLTPGAVSTLEADDYERLPAAVYVRGYIRRYCSLLELDHAPLLATYEALQAEFEKTRDKGQRVKVSQSQAMRNHYQPDRRRVHLLMLVAVAAVLITAAVVVGKWLYKEYSAALANGQSALAAVPVMSVVTDVRDQASLAPIHSTAQVPAGNETLAVEVATVGPDSPGFAITDATVAVEENAGGTAPGDIEAPGGEVGGERNETSPDAPGLTPAPPGALELTFAQESWVKVVDGNGAVLVMAQKSAGSRLSLSGQPPFSLVLGNAPGVMVEYRGASVPLTDINPQTRAARLVVGQ